MPLKADDMDDLLALLLKANLKKQDEIRDALRNAPPLPEEEPKPVEPAGPPPKPKRCQHGGCKTKLALTDFACKCQSWYCSSHRHAESHACTFDYKSKGQAGLEKNLVKVEADKLGTRL
jgi:hypothetical protein